MASGCYFKKVTIVFVDNQKSTNKRVSSKIFPLERYFWGFLIFNESNLTKWGVVLPLDQGNLLYF